MAVADFLQKYYDRYQPNNRPTGGPTAPIIQAVSPVRKTALNVEAPPVGRPQDAPEIQSNGSMVQALLANTKNNAQNLYSQKRNKSTTDLASDILSKSAGQVPVDENGVVQKPAMNFNSTANTTLNTIDRRGKIALQGAQDQATWQKLNQLQNLSNYNVSTVFGVGYDPKDIPAGANGNSPGAQAVAIAMQAYKNKTPYSWGGNSLTGGVDCSGLVQQAYAKLGIKLPRTTYEQAKSGQIIRDVSAALPGDLIFYNTGGRDPNGIGRNSHVAIYIGNGRVLEAANSREGIRLSNINYSGAPGTIVRPWS